MTLHLKFGRYLLWSSTLICVFLQGCITFSPSASHEITFNHTGWKVYANNGNSQMIFTPDGKKVTTRYIGYSAYLGTGMAPSGGTSIVGFGINQDDCQSLSTQIIPLNDGSIEMIQGMCYSYTITNINVFVTTWLQSIPFTHAIQNLTFTDPWQTYNRDHDQQTNQNHSLVTIVSYTRTFSSKEDYPNYFLQYTGLASATNKEEIKSLLINAKLTSIKR